MKREELKALGLTDEQINVVMENYGKSVKELQDGLTTAQSASESAKAELKKYLKGGENYIDTAELERLKTFEKDTLTREANAKKTAALTKLYKSANAADSVAKLLISGQDLEKLELDDKGELKNGTELLKKAKTDYADLFGGSGDKGVPQANPDAGGNAGNKTPQTVY